MNWIRRQLGGLMQNCVAGLLSSVVLVFGGAALGMVDGCVNGVRDDVSRGEAQLLRGAPTAALRIAADAVATAPRCGCAYELQAKANHQLMREALARQDIAAAETYRQACYLGSLKAGAPTGPSPFVTTLRGACKAPG